ncbi:MAG: hypothetical protein OEZ10_06210 [Gammaproteobacteria bacterium]|nr:hypothetical protein [Gammaproteobacteria bacterium]
MKAGIVRKLSALALAGLLFGCGPEGDDGLAYMSFDWSTAAHGWTFTTTNVSLPSTIIRNSEYQVQPGSYAMSIWGASGCNSYYLSYTITVDEGDAGPHPLIVGADGDDTYYDVYVWCFSAPDLYISGEDVNAPELLSLKSSNNDVAHEVVDQMSVGVMAATPVKTISKVSGGYRLEAEIYEVK